MKKNELKDYPIIDDLLIECLQRDFPDKLPNTYVNDFQLGVLLGQQNVIEKLITEKMYQETN
jgi:hypothetical protein